MSGRVRGSCRFETFYKLQRYDSTTCAWKEVRGSYGTAEEARAHALPGQFRVMTVSESGRVVGPVEVAQ